MRPATDPSGAARLPMGWLTGGLLAGVAYGVVDTAMDASLLPGGSIALDAFHRFFNMITPPMAGMAVAVLFAYMRQRDARVTAERRVSEALRERLKGVERQQAVWLLASSLLHDVRNPLHALGLLLDEAASTHDTHEAGAAIERARAQADRIEQRIRSLREMAESPPRDRVRVQAAPLIRGLVQDLWELAERAGVQLQSEVLEDAELEADERYLRTPIENLLVNAIHAVSSVQGGLVRVEARRVGRELSVHIIDNGPGVPAELQPVLFEPLHASRSLGMGLGLPLARALARLEGGEVRLLRNGPPETVFEFCVPIQDTAE